jgi:hypothetical protein
MERTLDTSRLKVLIPKSCDRQMLRLQTAEAKLGLTYQIADQIADQINSLPSGPPSFYWASSVHSQQYEVSGVKR